MQHDLEELRKYSAFINKNNLPLFYGNHLHDIGVDDDLMYITTYMPEWLLKTAEGQQILQDTLMRSPAYVEYLKTLPKHVKMYRRVKSFVRDTLFSIRRLFAKKRKFPHLELPFFGRSVKLNPNFNDPVYKQITKVKKDDLIRYAKQEVARCELQLKMSQARLAEYEKFVDGTIYTGSKEAFTPEEKKFNGVFMGEGQIPIPETELKKKQEEAGNQ
jgi:hypothetical protein